jgi:uncharacterized membrane protein
VPAGGRHRAALEARETSRVEAFSDGVFAIVVTLLVFNLHVPNAVRTVTNHGLWGALTAQWPTYAAFVITFLWVLIMWSNHHNMFNLISRVDHNFLLLNGLVLLGVTATPFTSSLLAEHFDEPSGRVAAMVYSAVALFISLAFNATWHYASSRRRLLTDGARDEQVRAVSLQYVVGPVAFAVALALAALSAWAGIAVFVLVEVFFALPLGANRVLLPD